MLGRGVHSKLFPARPAKLATFAAQKFLHLPFGRRSPIQWLPGGLSFFVLCPPGRFLHVAKALELELAGQNGGCFWRTLFVAGVVFGELGRRFDRVASNVLRRGRHFCLEHDDDYVRQVQHLGCLGLILRGKCCPFVDPSLNKNAFLCRATLL